MYYTAKVKIAIDTPKGVKWNTETYLVNAVSVTHAESLVNLTLLPVKKKNQKCLFFLLFFFARQLFLAGKFIIPDIVTQTKFSWQWLCLPNTNFSTVF